MRFYEIADKTQLPVSNEEHNFIQRYKDEARLTSLDEHDTWIAQNLVRKGVYAISKDNNTLVKQVNETNT